MFSQALDTLTAVHGKHLNDVIEIINNSSTQKALLMQRMFIVSLAAFWEAFHEELCKETLVRCPAIPQNASNYIEYFHNPTPNKIDRLYKNVLGIKDITESWWGNLKEKTGMKPSDFRVTIELMMKIRHDTAHGKWILPLSAADCQEFFAAVMHLAIQTDEKVREHFP